MHPTSSSPPRSSSSPSAASAASVTATAAASVASTTDDEPRTFSNTLSDDDLLSLVLSFLPLPSLTHSRATSKRFRTFVLRSLYARHGKSAVEKAIADLPADEEERKFHVRDLFADEDTRELILAALGEGRAQAWAWESEDPKTRKWLPYTPEATAALDAAYAAGEARCELLDTLARVLRARGGTCRLHQRHLWRDGVRGRSMTDRPSSGGAKRDRESRARPVGRVSSSGRLSAPPARACSSGRS